MKTLLIRIAAALVGLAALLLAFACVPETQTNKQSTTANAVAPSPSPTPEPKPTPHRACAETDLEKRRTDVKTAIGTAIESDPELVKMFKGDGGKPARFKFDVFKNDDSNNVQNYLEAVFEGFVNSNTELDDFARLMGPFLNEGCVHRFNFVPPGTLQPGGARPNVVGFEWHYCDYPLQACPRGDCKEDCNAITPPGNVNANANTPGNLRPPTNSVPNVNGKTNVANRPD